ncbi:DgyrCDS4557 [Dimorphilus gyrociliatus]|uniref:Peptidyl-prolyl cis-trans isomerase n=1 Tax=Dimorphilus gyrociliatus TaxID=2664684 RepID=A0A7I8VGX5_9ANNE|nr:DgyrCDS4557 [Dimorphilus gyrociliatus]
MKFLVGFLLLGLALSNKLKDDVFLKPKLTLKHDKTVEKVVPHKNEDPLTVTNETEIDIAIGGMDIGTIRLGLFGNTYPITTRNHIHLCNHTYGYGYRKAIFHRCIKDFMIQGGDYEYANGRGGHSIFVVNGQFVNFRDEDMSLVKHYGAGFVSMANAGPNTNGAQFVIQTVVTPWLDGHHVVFGKVLAGMRIVDLIQNVRTDGHDRPNLNVTIKACRVLPAPKPYVVTKLPVPLDQV